MGAVRKLTDQQNEQAVLLYQQGKTLTEIGEMFDVSYMTISRLLHKRGIIVAYIREPLPISDERKLAYLAGLFDGEGSINIFRKVSKYGVYPTYYLEISLSNTHKGVLQWVLENFGGRLAHNAEQGKGHKAWRWRASTQEAASVLNAILPYLIVKSEQAKLVLAFQKRVTAFQYRLTQEEVEWRENQRKQLSTLRFWKEDQDE